MSGLASQAQDSRKTHWHAKTGSAFNMQFPFFFFGFHSLIWVIRVILQVRLLHMPLSMQNSQ